MSINLSNLTMSGVYASASGSAPPAPPGDTYWSSVTLLTGTTGTNTQNNNVFLDTSAVGRTITRTGSPTQGSLAPFAISSGASYNPSTNGGSGSFNGSSDYLAFGTTNLTGDFTIECWFYQTAKSGSYVPIISGSTGTYNFPLILDYQGSGKIGYYLTSGQNAATASSVFSMDTWNHLAMVRSGSTITVYLNGASILTASGVSTDVMVDTAGGWSGAAGYLFNGYMSSVRVVDGTAVYNSTFTPSTQSLPATQGANAYGSPSAAIASGTQLLLNFTNAGIYDAAAMGDIFTIASAQVSTAQKKFGTSSAYFNASAGTRISEASSANFGYGTGDFTVEFWTAIASSTGNAQVLLDQRTAEVSMAAPVIYVDDAGTLYYFLLGANAIVAASAITGYNTWYHVAISRSSGSTKMFVNGTQVGGTLGDTNNYGSSLPIAVGASWQGNAPMSGYVQDLRVTKGVARYTANFTAPTAAFLTY